MATKMVATWRVVFLRLGTAFFYVCMATIYKFSLSKGDFKKKLELKALGKIELILRVVSVQRYHCDYHCTKYTYRFCSACR